MTEPARHKIPYLAASGSPVARELKEAREALGISVRDMAQTLRIRAAHIQALEEGRFDELPGRPYTLGFARSIARHLGLDADDVTQRLREEVMGTAPAVELVFPESTEDKRLSRAGWIVISLVLAAGAYGAWLALAHRDAPSELADVGSVPQTIPGSVPQTIPDAPGRDNALTGMSAADMPMDATSADREAVSSAAAGAPDGPRSDVEQGPSTGPSDAAAASAAPQAAPPEAPAQQSAASEASKPAEAAVAAPAAQPRPAVPANSAGAANATPTTSASPAEDTSEEDVRPEPTVVASAPPAPRVVLHADQDSWIQIQSPDGGTVVARTLKAGESYTVPDQSGLKLTTGNAGGLEIIVNGRPIPRLGQPGAVRRDVALDPARLAAGKALP